MKTATINLYSFGELSKEAQAKAIDEHAIFLNEVDPLGRNYTKAETKESIEINEYLYFFDGELADVTQYVPNHPTKAGATELNFHGEIISI